MQKKICPVCDTPLVNGRYCKNCRKFVKNPILWEQDFSLNEPRTGRVAPVSPQADVPKPVYQPQPPKTFSNSVSKPIYKPKRKGMALGVKIPLIISGVIVMLVLFALPVFLAVQESGISAEDFPYIPSPDSDYDDDDYDEAYEEYELTDEEVRAAGEACNVYDHGPIGRREMTRFIKRLLNDNSYGNVETNSDSYNMRWEYEEGDVETDYTTYVTFDLTGHADEDEESYMSASFDTAVDELHYVYIYSGNEKFIMDAAKKLAVFMDKADSAQSLDAVELEEKLDVIRTDPEGDVWVAGDNWSLFVYRTGEKISLDVSPEGQYIE